MLKSAILLIALSILTAAQTTSISGSDNAVDLTSDGETTTASAAEGVDISNDDTTDETTDDGSDGTTDDTTGDGSDDTTDDTTSDGSDDTTDDTTSDGSDDTTDDTTSDGTTDDSGDDTTEYATVTGTDSTVYYATAYSNGTSNTVPYVCNPAHSYPAGASCDGSGATPTLVYASNGTTTAKVSSYVSVPTTGSVWTNVKSNWTTPWLVATYQGAAPAQEIPIMEVLALGVIGFLLV